MAPPDCEPLCQFGERLFFTTFPHPAPPAAAINKLAANPLNNPPLKPRTSPHEGATYHYFTIDDRLLYFSFYEDWGPLNIAMLYKACILIHELLEEVAKPQRLVLYSSNDPRRKANSALLMSLFVMIVQRRAPWEAFQPIAEMEFIPFRDAGRGPSDFNLNIQDCLWGVWKAMQNGLLDMNDFDVDDYEYYEKVENGDWNWISPHFIAFASPLDPAWIKSQRELRDGALPTEATNVLGSSAGSSHALQRKLPTPFLNCLEYFEKRNVKMVVRLNTQLYDRNTFIDQGMEHLELYFDDGTNPTDEIVRTFLDVADRIIDSGGVVAVHCKAGLGRTASLIGAYLIYKYGFTANEAIAFMRILRPGSVVGPQQQYMYLKQLEWSKWAAVDEMRKQQSDAAVAATMATAPTLVTPATPPADTDEELPTMHTPPPMATYSLPPVTPSKHVAAAAAKAHAIPAPAQPRKTPNGKRVAREVDSDEEDELDDVLPTLDLVPRAKPRPARAATRPGTSTDVKAPRVTRSANRKPAPPASPTKASGQGPNKIPRLAATRTTAAAKAAVAEASGSRRGIPPPTPSRLPTLKRNLHASLTEVANATTRNKGAVSDAWMTTNVAAVVVPGTKSQRSGLRPVRRRRSSFSNADVLV